MTTDKGMKRMIDSCFDRKTPIRFILGSAVILRQLQHGLDGYKKARGLKPKVAKKWFPKLTLSLFCRPPGDKSTGLLSYAP